MSINCLHTQYWETVYGLEDEIQFYSKDEDFNKAKVLIDRIDHKIHRALLLYIHKDTNFIKDFRIAQYETNNNQHI